jgi:hypothetical protein
MLELSRGDVQNSTRPSDLAIPLDGPTSALFQDEVGVGGASRRALAAFRLGSILLLEEIGLVLSMTMPDQHVV